MSVDPEHIKLLAEKAAWEAIAKAREDEADRIAAGVARGMKAYFDQHGIGPQHWVYLENQLLEKQKDWGTVKTVVISTLLAAVLLFGGQAMWEKAAAKVLSVDQRQPTRASGSITPAGGP